MATLAAVYTLNFPGHVVGWRDPDHVPVALIQKRLDQLGCGLIAEDGDFGPTQESVELFQIRCANHFEVLLDVDGKVGPHTWASLFAIPLFERAMPLCYWCLFHESGEPK